MAIYHIRKQLRKDSGFLPKKATEMLEKKTFTNALVALVLPITIQNFLAAAVNFADVFMLGFVGQDALSAVSLANQYQFVVQGFFFGIASGITLISAQYWGKKDTDAIQIIMGIALKLGMIVTAILAVLAIVFPRPLMMVFTNDPALVEIGATYLRIIGISYFIMSFSIVYESMLRSVERARASVIISGTALVLNVFLNAVFIFGLFGAPQLGVLGVAIATLIARVVELVLCFIDLMTARLFRPKLALIFGRNRTLFLDFVHYSLPALINEVLWTAALAGYTVILGHMSADVVAANAITTNVRDLCTVLIFGLCVGGSVLLGKTIGAQDLSGAEWIARRLLRLTLIIGAITGAVVLLLNPLIPHMFPSLTDTATHYLRGMMGITAYYVVGQSVNTLFISGVFRAGGYTRFGLILDTVIMWGVSIPLGILAAFVFHAPPLIVYFILCLDEFWKIPLVVRHYRSRKWLQNITREYQ